MEVTVKTLRHELEVNATPETLWRIWSDPSRWGEWNPDIDHVSLKGPFATSRDPNSRTGRSSSRPEDRFRQDPGGNTRTITGFWRESARPAGNLSGLRVPVAAGSP